jgi:predicted RNase H-like nuclease (RuvC/YqgF family)
MTDTMTMTIACPHCGRQVGLDEAIVHQLAAPLRAGWEAQIRQQVDGEVQAAYARDLAAQRSERDELEGRLNEREAEIKNLRDQETVLLRARRKLEDEKEDLERATERMRDQIRAEERAAAEQRTRQRADEELHRKDEEHDTRTRQLEDQLKRVREQLEDAQRKSGTGSRQQEGLARQDLFAEELQRRFAEDLIMVTERGRRGPDVTQVVRAGRLDCGPRPGARSGPVSSPTRSAAAALGSA